MKESERTPRWMERLEIYGRALERLTDVIDLSRQHQLNDYERDSLIKRFEFTFEMTWKLTNYGDGSDEYEFNTNVPGQDAGGLQ